MDNWSVFTDRLRYTTPAIPAPGFDIQGQGCLDFSPERVNRLDQAKSVSMASLDFKHMQASEYMDRYNGVTIELNVNVDYDDAVHVTTTYLGQESGNHRHLPARTNSSHSFKLSHLGTVCWGRYDRHTP